MKAFFSLAMTALLLAFSFSVFSETDDPGLTLQQVKELSGVYASLNQEGPGSVAAIRLFFKEASDPIVIVDYWKAGITRRLMEGSLSLLSRPSSKAEPYDGPFSIRIDKVLYGWGSANLRLNLKKDRDSDSYFASATMQTIVLMGTARKIEPEIPINKVQIEWGDLSVQRANGVLFSDFIKGTYSDPIPFPGCRSALN